MKYLTLNPDGSVSPHDFNRARAVRHFCTCCRQGHGNPTGCQVRSCRLWFYREGRALWEIVEGGPHTAATREKAIKWFCLDCVQTGDGRPGQYRDVLACSEKTCALWPWRLLNSIDESVELKQ